MVPPVDRTHTLGNAAVDACWADADVPVPRLKASEHIGPLTTKVRLKMSGFSGGLATGLLVSMLATFVFLFSYAHRQQFGESLIRMGERLVSKTSPPSVAPQPQQPTSPIAEGEQPAAATRNGHVALRRRNSANSRWAPEGKQKWARFLRSEQAFAGLVIEG